MEYEFPFDVPDDIKALNRAEIEALFNTVVAHGKELSEDPNASVEALEATHALRAQVDERRQAFAAAFKKAEDFNATEDPPAQHPSADGGTDDPPAGDGGDPPADGGTGDGGTGDGGDAGDAVTASQGGAPSLVKLGGGVPKPTTQTPSNPEQAFATMTVASNVPDFNAGAQLTGLREGAKAIQKQMQHYSATGVPRERSAGRKRKSDRSNINYSASERSQIMVQHGKGYAHPIKDFTRHGALRLNRQYPDELRFGDGVDAYDRVMEIADEKRLPGGDLLASADALVKAGRSLTAAVGWCAPSEILMQLCELESLDGILDVPEMQADRGGFQIPEDGGIDFATLWNLIGNTHLSEYDVESGTPKTCIEVPCPDFVDVRLGVDYFCMTAGLLQRAAWPELIRRVARGAMIALAHKINAQVIADMVAAAGAPIVIPQDPGGDDAASSVLAAVELGIVDMKYRNRMPFASTIEVVLPMWVLPVIRAALSRRNGVDLLGVTDAMILAWFRERRAMPRFVYDWQDALAGLVGGPGGAVPIDAFPTTLEFLIYPAGTFVKAVQPVVNLDTIYDSTGLEQNQYTAMFVEDGWAVLQTCPDARLYQVGVDVSGCVGCIAAGTS